MPRPTRPFRPAPKPLADLLDACLDKTLAAQGFAAADVVVAWAEIAGERLAAVSHPLKLDWPRRQAGAERAEPATLTVRVEGAFALEMQHMAPVVIERVNVYYGWRCIGKLVLKQGPVRRLPKKRPSPPVLRPEDRQRIDRVLAPIEEDGLKAALDRLGQAVVGSRTKA